MSFAIPKVEIVTNVQGTAYGLSGWDFFVEWANKNDALWHFVNECGRVHCLQNDDVIKLCAYALLAERQRKLQEEIKKAERSIFPPIIKF